MPSVIPNLPTSCSPLSRMVVAISVKSPFSHSALFGLVVAGIFLPLRLATWLDGQERDTLDPVLGAGVACPVRDELVRVVSDLLNPQPRALDRLAVCVHLSGAADA